MRLNDSNRTRLTEEDVRGIRDLLRRYPATKLAAQLGVSFVTLQKALSGGSIHSATLAEIYAGAARLLQREQESSLAGDPSRRPEHAGPGFVEPQPLCVVCGAGALAGRSVCLECCDAEVRLLRLLSYAKGRRRVSDYLRDAKKKFKDPIL